ncbi:nuclear transport factor 2 family protein [Agromyces sp. NPDC056523]|uniref:nuclear transport factor 2 family protein n=1 Tax=Agromyces sp. NPDC056523 TaxID=3345850 RepID=UPI003672E19B
MTGPDAEGVTPEERRDASVVLDRLVDAINDHDLDRMVALFHPDYDSRQPAHPARGFVGREQVRANWAAMFAAQQGNVPHQCPRGRCAAALVAMLAACHVSACGGS